MSIFSGVREIDLFYNAKTWLEGGDGNDGRLERAGELMEQIKFPLIQPSSDLNEIKELDLKFMKTSTCLELLLEGTSIFCENSNFLAKLHFFVKKLELIMKKSIFL